MNTYLNILCALLLVGAVWSCLHSFHVIRSSKIIQGAIVGTNDSVRRGSSQQAPKIEYVDSQGNKRVFVSRAAATNFEAGSAVWVAYNSENEKPMLISLGEIFILPTILALLGIVLLLLILPVSKSSQVAYEIFKTVGILGN